MEAFLQPVLDWVAAHPRSALAVVAAGCFIDALLLVGFLVPSYLLLLGVGTLVSLDVLPLWPVVLAAAFGAMVGDGFNYWLGRRYLERWTRHPRMTRLNDSVVRSREYFRRRGALALVVSRLIGPTRPIGPLIAGAGRMPLPRFWFWTVIACLVWALVFILPGVAIGASLQLAAEVATRLAILLLGSIVLIGGLIWLVSLLVRIGTPAGEHGLHLLLAWSARHRRMGRLPRWLVDPRYPETPALLILALILMAGGWLALLIGWGLARDAPMAVDALVYRQMLQLHTPMALEAARWLAHLGDPAVLVTTSLAGLLALLALGRGRAAGHMLAALAFGVIIALALGAGLHVPDPAAFYDSGPPSSYTGADLILVPIVFGLLPLLLTRPAAGANNLKYYRLAVVLPGLIAAAQLYLGTQWFSVAAGSLVIGGLWMLLLGIGYRRHPVQPVPAQRWLLPVVSAFTVAAIVLPAEPLPNYRDATMQTLSTDDWLQGEWRQLPIQRGDGRGQPRQLLSVQWRATAAARDAALATSGWEPATEMNLRALLRTLSPSAPIADLPVPPQPLLQQLPALMMSRAGPDADSLVVLRLWRAPARVGGEPLWIGHVSLMRTRRLLGLLRLPYTDTQALSATEWLAALPNTRTRTVQHPEAANETSQLLLLQTANAPVNDRN